MNFVKYDLFFKNITNKIKLNFLNKSYLTYVCNAFKINNKFIYDKNLNKIKDISINNNNNDLIYNYIIHSYFIRYFSHTYKYLCPICKTNSASMYSTYNKCTACYRCKIKICLKRKLKNHKCTICN